MSKAEETIALTLLAIAVVVALARLLGMAARLIRQPAVVGEILAGIALGPSLLGALHWKGASLDEHLFPPAVQSQLQALANLGLVIFMFVVGLELDLARVRTQRGRAVAVSVTSVAFPMACGALLSLLLWSHHGGEGGPQRKLAFIVFIGVAMSVTAFPVLARILSERRMHRTALGSLALACAAVDDVLAWSLLAIATTLAMPSAAPWWHTPTYSALFILLMFVVVRPIARGLVRQYDRVGRLTPDVFAAIIVGILFCAWTTNAIGIHFIFGAFLFGAVFPRDVTPDFVQALLQRLEDISVLVLLPVFFIITGLKVDLTGLSADDLMILCLVIVTACIGKFVGTFVAARLSGVRPRAATALGVLLNTRGLTELVVLTVAMHATIIDSTLFAVFVVMAVVTTMMTEPLLRLVYPEDLVLRDVAAAERAALGVPEAHRALVALVGTATDAAAVRTAAAILHIEPARQIVLSRVVRQGQTTGELGSGLINELAAVADVVESSRWLEVLIHDFGVEAVPLTRLGADEVTEWCGQADELEVDAIVIAQMDTTVNQSLMPDTARLLEGCHQRVIVVQPAVAMATGWGAIQAVDLDGQDAAAVFDVSVRLAVALRLPLLLDAPDGSLSRRARGWARRCRSQGLSPLTEAENHRATLSKLITVGSARSTDLTRPDRLVLVRAGLSEPADLVDDTMGRIPAPNKVDPAARTSFDASLKGGSA